MKMSSIWPATDRAAIIAPGPHRSYLDGPTIALATPKPILFAVTPDFALHPVWRPILLMIGQVRGCMMIPIKVGQSAGVRALLKHVNRGGWVCVFPDGGLNSDIEHPGVAWLSQKSGVPIHHLSLKHMPGLKKIAPITSIEMVNGAILSTLNMKGGAP